MQTFLVFGTLKQQIEEIDMLKQSDSKRLEELMALGNRLVQAARDSDLDSMKSCQVEMGQDRFFTWHIAKAFKRVIKGHSLDCLQFMTENGLNLRNSIFKGALPLLASCPTSDIDLMNSLIDTLLAAGVSINDTEKSTYSTALHIATALQNVPLVRLLLEKGADVNAINKLKIMPLNIVQHSSNPEAIEIHNLFIDAGGEGKWNSYEESGE